jgi:two-component system LytT family response regulator
MKCIIIDDEKHCREVLQVLIQKHCPQLTVLQSFASAKEAIEGLELLQPDLIFLDIEMPGMNGFEFLESFSRRDFAVIFTTAYNEYAIKAIKHSALDYLLKPIDKDELVQAVERARDDRSQKTAGRVEQLLQSMMPAPTTRRFAVPTLEGLTLINPDDILYVKSDGPYSHFYFTDGRHLLISKTLKEAEEVLPANDFFRIHNSYMVNMKYVQKYLRGEGGEVVMSNGEQLPVSRNKKQEFLGLLEKI